ncbi:MAG: WecB/TagA/CpsF family glycosyltransferase [Planctomycetota bacterium]
MTTALSHPDAFTDPASGAATGRLPKRDLFGVGVTAAGPDAVVDQVMDWAHRRESRTVDFMPVHGLMVAVRDAEHRERMNGFDAVACDGQPIRWSLNKFHGAGLAERVYGPTTMLRVCERCAAEGVGVYLYGGRPEVLEELAYRLCDRLPELKIVGAESPPFRPLTEEEDAAAVRRINASGAGVIFLGIGCPRQEVFAAEHRDRLKGVQLCVGAAFDFHAGAVRQAPAWMQKRGLEWLYRLTREPGRLWKRYLVTNSLFVAMFTRRWVLGR